MAIRTLVRPVVLLTVSAVAVLGIAAPSPAAVGDDTSFALAAGATPYGTVLGPDGAIWIATGAANSIARIDAKGVVTNFPVPTAASTPRFITVGSDKNLWFTEQTGNKIGRITTAGVITEFPVTTPGAEPFAIAPGPDGNLWFTEQAANKIGRITTSGSVTEFTIPTPASVPYGIVAGPAGSNDMYFTESAGDKIGKITSSGAITEFPLTTGARPFGIATVGSALWVAEHGINKLAQLQGSTVLEISLPAGTQPLWITQGPGPTMWVSFFGTSSVAVFTAAGSLQAIYPLDSGAKPTGLTQGSDGNIWVAESGIAKVARVLSGQLPSSVAPPVVTPSGVAVGATATTTSGTWAYEPTSYTYQWQRCTTNATTSCAVIPGAAAATYVVTSADAGKHLISSVAATNLNGSVSAVNSVPVQVGGSATPAPTASPTPTPTATSKRTTTLLTIAGPAAVARGSAATFVVTVNPSTAAGVVNLTYRQGAKRVLVTNLKPVNGVVSSSFAPPANWSKGKGRVIARFAPTSPTVNSFAKSIHLLKVR
ncbi:MAG: hypothetical protein Q7K25_05925 [Actinomycetota bacterium]|nr:hypothetical protein [Actinomycetota bacterium]